MLKMAEVSPMSHSEIMTTQGEATSDEADIMILGFTQNICYLCGKEFQYRIQLKKHLSKFHSDDVEDNSGTIDPEMNADAGTSPTHDDYQAQHTEQLGDSKAGASEKENLFRNVKALEDTDDTMLDESEDIGNSANSNSVKVSEVTEHTVHETDSDSNTVDNDIVSYDNADNNKVNKMEKAFNADTFVADLNKGTADSKGRESTMKFEEVENLPNEVSDLLSNSNVTFAQVAKSDSEDATINDDDDGMIVIGTNDNRYIRNKPDPSRLKYDCEKCDQRFEFPYQLKRHTKIVHEGEYPYACDKCGKAFDRISGLKDHAFVHSNQRSHKCKLCDQSFKMKGNLKKHMVKHNSEKMFKCEHCGRRFLLREQLVSHLVVHTGDKPFICDTCGKPFARKTNLKQHVLIHSAVKKFPCPKCDKIFLRPYSRKVHMRNHLERKPHECSVCSASFSQRCSLLQHVRLHTGERPFHCPFCNRDFVQQSTLISHVATHTGEKKHQCGICEKAFLRKRCLDEHILIHSNETPFKCDECDYASKTKPGLDRHRVKHLASKDFVCHICDRAFLRKRSFMFHSRIHTGERPYKCNVCSFATTTVGNVNKHIRIHMKKMLNTADMTVKEFKSLSAAEMERFHPLVVEENTVIPERKEKRKRIRKSKKKLISENATVVTAEGNVVDNSETVSPVKVTLKIKRKRPLTVKVKKIQANLDKVNVGTAVLRSILQKKPKQRKEKTGILALSSSSSTNYSVGNLNGIKVEPGIHLQKETQTHIADTGRNVFTVSQSSSNTERENKPATSSVLRTLLQKDMGILENLSLVSDLVSSVQNVKKVYRCANIKSEVPASDSSDIFNKASRVVGDNMVHLPMDIKQEPLENDSCMIGDEFDSKEYAKQIIENSLNM